MVGMALVVAAGFSTLQADLGDHVVHLGAQLADGSPHQFRSDGQRRLLGAVNGERSHDLSDHADDDGDSVEGHGLQPAGAVSP